MLPKTQTIIAEYNKTAAALAELRGKFGGVVFEVSSTVGLKAAKEARAEVKGYRVELEKVRKEIKAPALQRCKDIDEEARRITAELLALEDPIDEQIKAEEQRKAAEKAAKEEAERKRRAEIQLRIIDIRNMVLVAAGANTARIAELISELKAFEITFEEFGECAGEAMLTQSQTLAVLQDLHGKAVERERIAEEQAEQERQAKAERERREAELRAEREELKRKAEEVRRIQEEGARKIKEEQERIADERAEMQRRRQAEAEAETQAKARAEAVEAPKVEAPTIAEVTPIKPANPDRPSDDEIIEVLALHFHVHEYKVIEWLFDMDLEFASQQLAKAV